MKNKKKNKSRKRVKRNELELFFSFYNYSKWQSECVWTYTAIDGHEEAMPLPKPRNWYHCIKHEKRELIKGLVERIAVMENITYKQAVKAINVFAKDRDRDEGKRIGIKKQCYARPSRVFLA